MRITAGTDEAKGISRLVSAEGDEIPPCVYVDTETGWALCYTDRKWNLIDDGPKSGGNETTTDWIHFTPPIRVDRREDALEE